MAPTGFKEFNLLTNNIKTKEVQPSEERILSECKPFKALELNKKIFEVPQTNVERKSCPPSQIQFHEFKFKTEERLEEIRRKKLERKSAEQEYVFKARDMPKFPDPSSPQKTITS